MNNPLVIAFMLTLLILMMVVQFVFTLSDNAFETKWKLQEQNSQNFQIK